MQSQRCLSHFDNNEWHIWNILGQDHSYPHLSLGFCLALIVYAHAYTFHHNVGFTNFLQAIVSAGRWWYPGLNLPLPRFLSSSFTLPSSLALFVSLVAFRHAGILKCPSQTALRLPGQVMVSMCAPLCHVTRVPPLLSGMNEFLPMWENKINPDKHNTAQCPDPRL